jgi:hypothetical protein
MEKIRAEFDQHYSKARSAPTLNGATAEYEEAVNVLLGAYLTLLEIMHEDIMNDLQLTGCFASRFGRGAIG